MDSESQATANVSVPSTEPAKMYDPAEVKVWPSSPLIPALSSIPAENNHDMSCPSLQTLPDCFDNADITNAEMQEALASLNNISPPESLFVHQDGLQLPEIPPAISEHGEESMDVLPDGTEQPKEDSDWPQDISLAQLEAEEAEAHAKFEAVELWFKSLQTPSMVDRVTYEKAKMDDNARMKQIVRRKAVTAKMVRDGEDLPYALEDQKGPFSQTQGDISQDKTLDDTSPNLAPVAKKRKRNALTTKERQRSIQLGLDVVLGKARAKGPERKEKDSGPSASKPSGRVKKQKKPSKKQMDKKILSLLSTNLIQDSQANTSLPAIPRFNKADKQKALAELIASIPNANHKETSSDKKNILEASKKFQPSARTDGNNGWKIRGIKSSLYHYQLLGAAFMRGRELSDQAPFGGLLSDTMGFGKTIQAIANVVDGKPADEDDPVKTTLIVVPSHLVEHWREQFFKHCEPDNMPDTIIYRSNSRIDTFNEIKGLQKWEVIITTYEEIRRSYPRTSAAPNFADETALTYWWNEVFQEHAGPLHRIKFLRIILDEGHVIKNHLSQTSIAVRALTGQFKWILSGTPVQNSIQEFYPLFDFLGVPGNDNFEMFEDYYYNDDDSQKRLVNILRTVMFRRTHASRLFALPVIKFPDIEERIVVTDFYEAERKIYDAIVEVFFNNINECATSNPKLSPYRCILTMMLRLRMFCSHILTTQDMLKDLLSGPVSKALTNIEHNYRDPKDPSVIISLWMRALAKGTTLTEKQAMPEDPRVSASTIQGDKAKLIQQFHQKMCKLHEEEQWDERLDRTNCPSCKMVPVMPVITSCMHLYCEECYYVLGSKEPGLSNAKPVCVECNEPIQEAALGVEVENINLPKPSAGTSAQQNKQKNTRNWSKAVTQGRSHGGMLRMAGPRSGREPKLEEETDWINIGAEHIPSAKLTKIRETVAAWIADNPNVKVVIFTQFLDFVRILALMCRKEGWKFSCLTGKMSLYAREENLKDFGEKQEIRLLLASLKAGGIGLNMSMASKCILVDLWWNEAIQDQAFCRLYRIGQDKNVEYVKIIIRDTIDEYLLDLQSKKTGEITSAMGDDVLAARETVKTLLALFGDVTETDEGWLHVVRRKDKKQKPPVN